jgi:hypothetical protein
MVQTRNSVHGITPSSIEMKCCNIHIQNEVVPSCTSGAKSAFFQAGFFQACCSWNSRGKLRL